MEHAIVELGTDHLHVVGEAEAPLKRAPRNAAVQVAVSVLLLLLLRLARHQERVLVNGDIELGRREAGHSHCQPVGVVTGLLDIVRRVAGRCAVNAACRIEQAEQTIEADRRTEQRREIDMVTREELSSGLFRAGPVPDGFYAGLLMPRL
jgi:hypothetical protein